jgi:hypothetical protein
VKRRDFVAAALATAAWGARAAPPRATSSDFDALWESIDSGYAYFDAASRARWRAVRERLRGPAGRRRYPSGFEFSAPRYPKMPALSAGEGKKAPRTPYHINPLPGSPG